MAIHRAASLLLLCGVAACASTSPDAERVGAAPAPVAADPTPVAPVDMVGSAPHTAHGDGAPAPVAPSPSAEPDDEPADAPSAQVVAGPRPAATPAATKPRPAGREPRAALAPTNKTPMPTKAVAGVSGRLDLVAGGRERIAAGEVAEGLVYFLPKSGGAAPKPGTFTVDTRSKGFSPSVLVVPVGSTVRFPNRDSILHNVFSRSPGSTFDFGYYGPGESRQRVFSKPGLVIVNCNVHHNMRADIVVLATPYFTRPDRSGRYTLTGLPPGPGTLVFWHPRADAQQALVDAPSAAAVSRRLVATKPSRTAGMAGH